MMVFKRLCAPLAVVAIAVGAGAGCGSDSGDGGSTSGDAATGPIGTLTIGDLEALTGDLGAYGAPFNKAVKLAVEQAGLAGRASGALEGVELVEADTQGEPQAATSAARRVVDEGATCITGPISTPEAVAVLNAVTKVRRIPMLPWGTSAGITELADDDTVFRTTPPDNLQVHAMVAAAEEALGGAEGTTVAFGYQVSPYGEGLAKAFQAEWEKRGGSIQGPVGYDPTQSGYDSEAAKLTEGSPGGWVIADYPDTYGKVGAALLRTGRFDARRLIVADALAVSPVPRTIPAAALEGAHGSRAGTPPGTAQSEAYERLYADAPGPGPSSFTANAFDGAIICALAAVKAGSTEPEAIAAAIPEVVNGPGETYSYLELEDAMTALMEGRDVNYEGVSGALELDEAGDPKTGIYDLFTFTGGRLVVEDQMTVDGA